MVNMFFLSILSESGESSFGRQIEVPNVFVETEWLEFLYILPFILKADSNCIYLLHIYDCAIKHEIISSH